MEAESIRVILTTVCNIAITVQYLTAVKVYTVCNFSGLRSIESLSKQEYKPISTVQSIFCALAKVQSSTPKPTLVTFRPHIHGLLVRGRVQSWRRERVEWRFSMTCMIMHKFLPGDRTRALCHEWQPINCLKHRNYYGILVDRVPAWEIACLDGDNCWMFSLFQAASVH